MGGAMRWPIARDAGATAPLIGSYVRVGTTRGRRATLHAQLQERKDVRVDEVRAEFACEIVKCTIAYHEQQCQSRRHRRCRRE